jgi:hypothetical protein
MAARKVKPHLVAVDGLQVLYSDGTVTTIAGGAFVQTGYESGTDVVTYKIMSGLYSPVVVTLKSGHSKDQCEKALEKLPNHTDSVYGQRLAPTVNPKQNVAADNLPRQDVKTA